MKNHEGEELQRKFRARAGYGTHDAMDATNAPDAKLKEDLDTRRVRLDAQDGQGENKRLGLEGAKQKSGNWGAGSVEVGVWAG